MFACMVGDVDTVKLLVSDLGANKNLVAAVSTL